MVLLIVQPLCIINNYNRIIVNCFNTIVPTPIVIQSYNGPCPLDRCPSRYYLHKNKCFLYPNGTSLIQDEGKSYCKKCKPGWAGKNGVCRKCSHDHYSSHDSTSCLHHCEEKS